MNIRKNGFILIVSSLLVLLVLSELSTRYFENARRAVNEARGTYISALTQTRAQLASHLYDISHDPVLISNLAAQLSYSINRSLEGEIHQGSFDFYALFDENCKLIAKTGSNSLPPGLCQKNLSDRWRWTSVSDKPLMLLLKSRTDLDKPFFIGAGRFLTDEWVRSFPSLIAKFEAANLKWGTHAPRTLCTWPRLCSEFNSSVWAEGRGADGVALASLVSKTRFFPLLRPWLVSKEPLSNPLAFPGVSLVFILLIIEFLQRRFTRTKEEEDKKKFLRWCERPLGGSVPTPEFPWLEAAQKSLNSTLQECAHRCSELRKVADKYEKDSLSLHEALRVSERKLSEHIPYALLSTHIAESGMTVRAMLASFLEGTADLSSVLEKSLLPASRKMLDMLKIWQNGMSVRGERYFMRSLYEQESKPGESILRNEFNRIFAFTEQINATVLHSLTLLKHYQDQEGEAASILENWSILAMKVKDPSLKLNRIAEASAALLQTTSSQRISFLSNLPSDFNLVLPVPTLLGTFLMLFTAMKEGIREGKDETMVFQIHKRHKNDQFILALSVTNDRGKALLCSPREDLLERVVEILKPWNIPCQEIHRPEGGSYIVLRGDLSLIAEDTRLRMSAMSSFAVGTPTIFQPDP